MELDVFALALEQFQKPISQLILSNSLISNEENVLAENPVGQQGFENSLVRDLRSARKTSIL